MVCLFALHASSDASHLDFGVEVAAFLDVEVGILVLKLLEVELGFGTILCRAG